MNNLSSRSYNEKRDFIRMKVDTEIQLVTDDDSINGKCRDLSGTGMLIEVQEPIGEGAICKTTLPSNNEAFPSLDATVKVLRCTQVDESRFHIGTEILNIEN